MTARPPNDARPPDGVNSKKQRRAECPGVPFECEHAQRLLMEATNGILPPARTDALRQELQECPPCLEAVELELSVQKVIALHCRVQAPENLRIRISEAFERVELDSLEVGDLKPPPWNRQ